MDKPKTSISWKTSDRRAKQNEISDLRILVIPIWCTFDLVMFKVIFGSLFLHLGFFVMGPNDKRYEKKLLHGYKSKPVRKLSM